MNPNAYLAVAIQYLFSHRPNWRADAGIGKTLVSSSLIDKVAADLGRTLVEVPVGFKWFVPGLTSGDLGFGGEESAGASFLARDGSTWTTDKDGILLALLASEIKGVTGKSPSEHYADLEARFGASSYARVDAPATREQKAKLGKLSASDVTATRARRRADHRHPDPRPRQRCGHRRAEGHHGFRVVRRPPLGHRERVQDLRRVPARARTPCTGSGRGQTGGRRSPGLTRCEKLEP